MSIRTRLVLGTTAVALAAVMVLAAVLGQATSAVFERYVGAQQAARGQELANLLGDYYATTGGWQGVESLLRRGGPGRGLGRGQGMSSPGTLGGKTGPGGSPGPGRGPMERLVIADAGGVVVGDSQDRWTGQPLADPSVLASGYPITYQGRRVGTLLLIAQPAPGWITLEQQFTLSVRRAAVVGAGAAALLAIGLGLYLSGRLTRPLRSLAEAAGRLGERELSYRVHFAGRDEIAALAQAMNAMAGKLEAAERARQDFTADVAHELRNPLAVMRSTLESVQDGALELSLELVSSLHDQVIRLSRLSNDLLDLSLAGVGRLHVQPRLVPGALLFEGPAEVFRLEAEARGLRFEVSIPPDLPAVRADADRIAQVVLNLLSNAMAHTPQGGTVRLSARVSEETRPGHLEVLVSNTGPGLPAEQLEKIFERYYRADPPSGGGTGLGLAIARELVQAHGGRIRAENGSENGLRCLFTLPLEGATSAAAR